MGVEQDCNTVLVDNCRPVSREECHDVQDTVERKVPEQGCQNRQVTSYKDSQECNTVSKEVCRNVPKQECKDVPVVVEKLVPVQVCNTMPRQVCRDESKQVCLDQPKEICNEEPVEVCDVYDQKSSHQTCKDVTKTNCHPVSEEV